MDFELHLYLYLLQVTFFHRQLNHTKKQKKISKEIIFYEYNVPDFYTRFIFLYFIKILKFIIIELNNIIVFNLIDLKQIMILILIQYYMTQKCLIKLCLNKHRNL